MFPYFVLFFLVKLMDFITVFTRVLLIPLGGVIGGVLQLLLLCFTLCPFVTKKGSNFYFGPGMYFQTGQVFLSYNGQKGSLLGCDWLHSVWTKSFVCKRCFLIGILLFISVSEDSTLFASQKSRFPASRPDDVSYRLDAKQTKASSVWMTSFSVWTLHCI